MRAEEEDLEGRGLVHTMAMGCVLQLLAEYDYKAHKMMQSVVVRPLPHVPQSEEPLG